MDGMAEDDRGEKGIADMLEEGTEGAGDYEGG